eukprot:TRINITY_DN12260_c0_g2_i1.p1 TRINITY_DN12260_c0_g2~~TRINITY_DN12260_c0_g2_i1.p1  ORF type:complete len:590 (-),score=103.82 TRINITY_DN12260_c0_g2_i1:28-1797(-)
MKDATMDLREFGRHPFGGCHSITIETRVAREMQEILAHQLQQVKQTLECNELIAKQLAVLAGSSGGTAPKDATAANNQLVLQSRGDAESPMSKTITSRSADMAAGHVAHRPSLPVGYMHADRNRDAGDLAVPLLSIPRPTLASPCPSQEEMPSSPLEPKTKRRSQLLFDFAGVKQIVEEAFDKEHYDVESFFHTSGCCRSVATNSYFKNVTFAVILLNTIWIAIDTDYNHAVLLSDADAVFQIADNIFCTFFTLELAIRFGAFSRKADATRDGWFVFDLVLVVVMIWETWLTPIFILIANSGKEGEVQGSSSSVFRVMRLFRLLRAGRVLRLLRSFPELMILVQAMMAALRSVIGTLGLLFVIIYAFAILLTQLLRGLPVAKNCFETVPQSMNCLVLASVFPDQKDMLQMFLDEGWMLYVLNLIFFALSCLTVMNLLIGVLCEVVSEVARYEKDSLLANDIKARLLEVMEAHGEGDKSAVCAEGYKKLVENPQVLLIFLECGIDVQALVAHAHFLFAEEDHVSFRDVARAALKFRHENVASVKDVVQLRKAIMDEFCHLEARVDEVVRQTRFTRPQRSRSTTLDGSHQL